MLSQSSSCSLKGRKTYKLDHLAKSGQILFGVSIRTGQSDVAELIPAKILEILSFDCQRHPADGRPERWHSPRKTRVEGNL